MRYYTPNFLLKLILIFFSLLFIALPSSAQSDTLINRKLLAQTFSSYHAVVPVKKKIVSFSGKRIGYKINPFNYLAAGALFVYQRILSEQIQADCNYAISCSEFTKQSISRYGFMQGVLSGIHQFSNCFPGAVDEHVIYFLTEDFKIINAVEHSR